MKTIRNTIMSIKNHIDDPEIIVVDDNSNDDTVMIINDIGVDRLVRSRVHSGGPNKGRNIGLDIMTGDAFCFLDHDDEVMPTFNSLTNHLDGVAFGGFFLIDRNMILRCESMSNDKVIELNKYEFFKRILSRNKSDFLFPNPSSMLIDKKYRKIKFEEIFGCCDYDYLIRLFHNVSDVKKIDTPVVKKYTQSASLSLKEDFRLKDYHYSNYVLHKYEDQYPKEVNLARKRLTGTLARYFYCKNDMVRARYYFKRSLSFKTFLYYLSTFGGSEFVQKKFKVMGS